MQEKQRIGSKIIKHHDKPTTPCDRLRASRYISNKKRLWLKEQRQSLNPFTLQIIVHQTIKAILRLCSLPPQLLHIQVSGSIPTNNQSKHTNLHRTRNGPQQPRQRLHPTRENNNSSQGKIRWNASKLFAIFSPSTATFYYEATRMDVIDGGDHCSR